MAVQGIERPEDTIQTTSGVAAGRDSGRGDLGSSQGDKGEWRRDDQSEGGG